jgi:hypothetical protein
VLGLVVGYSVKITKMALPPSLFKRKYFIRIKVNAIMFPSYNYFSMSILNPEP